MAGRRLGSPIGPTASSGCRSESGFGSLWIAAALPGLVTIFFVSFSLWSGYNGRQQLAEVAEAAARSGAGVIDEDAFYDTGELLIDEQGAILAAGETLAENRALLPRPEIITSAEVSVVDGERVIVEMTGSVNLPVFGSIPVRASASSEPRQAAAPDDSETVPDADAHVDADADVDSTSS